MQDIDAVKQLLVAKNYTCVLSNGNDVIVSTKRGVKPLVELIESGKDFSGFVAADKIVGKAAALLYVNLKVSVLYALVTTNEAVQICNKNNIKIFYETLTEKIINRNGNDICPMEKLVANISTPKEALKAIVQKLKTM